MTTLMMTTKVEVSAMMVGTGDDESKEEGTRSRRPAPLALAPVLTGDQAGR